MPFRSLTLESKVGLFSVGKIVYGGYRENESVHLFFSKLLFLTTVSLLHYLNYYTHTVLLKWNASPQLCPVNPLCLVSPTHSSNEGFHLLLKTIYSILTLVGFPFSELITHLG